MATLESIEAQLNDLPAAIASAISTAIAALPASQPVDLTPVLSAISALSTEIKTNVEGVAPAAPAPDSAPTA